jgi:hypothetical protein
MTTKSKWYEIPEQRGGTILGFPIEDHRIFCMGDEIDRLESTFMYKQGRIRELETKKQDIPKETAYLDGMFTSEQLNEIKNKLTKTEITDAINLLLEGKYEKTEEVKQSETKPLKVEDLNKLTYKELKENCDERGLQYKRNSSKEALINLLKGYLTT